MELNKQLTKMRIIKVTTKKLIPIEPLVSKKRVLYFLHNKIKDPIATIGYKNKYLMRDGHHRICACELQNKLIKIKVLETDYETFMCEEGIFAYIHSIEGFIEFYEKLWKINIGLEKIGSVRDLIKKHNLEKLIKKHQKI